MLFFTKEQSKEINRLKWQMARLQKKLTDLENQTLREKQHAKAQLLRIKNGEKISDDFIVNDSSYTDLSPEKAFEIYNDLDKDFVLLDVSSAEYQPYKDLPEAIKIPFDELYDNTHKLFGSAKRYIIISENGLSSIRACKLLYQKGFYNLSNISGGYSFWPGFGKQTEYKSESNAA